MRIDKLIRLSLVFALLSFIQPLGVGQAGALEFVYLNPAPGAHYISPGTSIAVRQGAPLDRRSAAPRLFTVVGGKSGLHSGTTTLSDDGRTLLFYPDEPFQYGEEVTVQVGAGLRTLAGERIAPAGFHFYTLESAPRSSPASTVYAELLDAAPAAPTRALADFDFKAYPELSNTMPVTVTTPVSGTADGLIFITSTGIGGFPYDHSALILDDAGQPVYIKRLADDKFVTDFKVQTVAGVKYLVYHEGTPVRVWSNGTYYVMDDTYTVVDEWTVGNGYGADEHEIQLLENGHALMISYVTIPYDLSSYDGPEDGEVVEALIQEQDSHKNVVFEWHSIHHIPLSDSHEILKNSPVDYIHTNAIEVDFDGNLLISSRGLSEITKIDHETGSIVWRLGGKKNEFTFTNDYIFSYQHDIRRLPNGNLTLFDNGNGASPPHSRAVEYHITPGTTQITRVWQYPDDFSLFAPFMGGVQRLDNGNSMIGWGAIPMLTEVRPDGAKAIEMTFAGLTYRAYRFTWDAVPVEPARLIYEASGDPEGISLHFGWNGATGIEAYHVYAGPDVSNMRMLTVANRDAFELSTTLTGLNPDDCYFRMDPQHEDGLEMPSSNTLWRMDTPQCAALVADTVYFPVVMQAPSIASTP